MIQLTIGLEWMMEPLYIHSGLKIEYLTPEDLCISRELQCHINRWTNCYQSLFNEEYPPESGFSDPEAEQELLKALHKEGKSLSRMLQSELTADKYIVIYRSFMDCGKPLKTNNDL